MENKMIKILAIDDNRDNLISIKAIISEVLPHSVVYMELSGQDGIGSAREKDPDVILLDIVMPVMDGYEICKTLKADEQLSEIPVIFLTALKGDKQSRILALEAGGEAFLAKPIDATELKAQILAMLKIKEAARYKRDQRLHLEELVQKRTEELKGANIAALNLLEDLNAEIEIRKESEEALKESEVKYRYMFENNPQPMWIYDLETLSFLEANNAAINHYGYSRKEFLSMTLKDIRPKEDIEALLHDVEKTRKSYNPAGQWRHLKKNGELIFVEIISHSITFSNRKARHVLVNDITERKQAEEKLKLLNRAVEASSVAVEITDAEGNIIYVNPYFTELTGYSYEEVLGKNPRFLKSGNQPKTFYENLWNTILSGQDWTGEFQNKKKNGELYWEKAVISPILNSNGKVANFVAIKEDITEHKRFEDTRKLLLEISQLATKHITPTSFLAEVHQKLKKIIRSDNFYVALYNEADQTFTFPYHVDEYDSIEMNKPYKLRNSYTDHVLKTNQSLIVTPENQHAVEKDGSTKEYGDQLSVLLGVPFKTTEGSNPNGVIAIQDYQNMESYTETDKSIMEIIAHSIGSFIERIKYIEDLVQARKKAEESDKLKSAFLNNVSHEVRTPLNGILGFGQIMAQTGLSQTEKAEYLGILQKSTDRLMDTITGYVDISMIVSGSLSVNIKPVSFAAFLNTIHDMYKPKCDAKELELSLQLPADLQNIKFNTDPELLRKAMQHILNNAVQYTGKGGIAIVCERKGPELYIFVQDTGIGIERSFQEKVFDVFVQEDMSITRNYEGSGLGLSIAKGLIKKLGGRITIESEKGKGTSVQITIPYEAEKEVIELEAVPEAKTQPAESPLVLVAEDEITNYLYLEVLLTKSGIRVLHAENGAQAVAFCKQNPEISLVLMDIKMPVMGGLEATRQIKEFRKDLPIIAITAYAQTGDEFRIREAGCDDYLAKPVKINDLKKLINKILG